MELALYQEEWPLLVAAISVALILGLTFVLGLRFRLAWSQLPAAARDAELKTLVQGQEANHRRLEKQIQELEEQKRGLQAKILERDRLEEEAGYWRSQIEATKAEYAGMDAMRRDVEHVREDYRQAIEKLADKERLIGEAKGKLEDALNRTEAVERLLSETQQRIEDRSRALEELSEKIHDSQATLANAREEARIRIQQEMLRQREERVEATQGETDTAESESDNSLEDLLTPPVCLDFTGSGLTNQSAEEDENKALDRVYRHLQKSGFDFNERQIKAFHTSLKTASISPLTVLAGISGTGKSQLPRYYAEAMGMHFLKIPVQPRWDGPQDLFGFYNYIEQRYRATDLARALVHLDPYNWPNEASKFNDRMLLVLLDEMNLARVEHYFSEFLSRLEGRPVESNATNEEHRRPSEIEIDVSLSGRKSENGQSRRVYVGHNVLFVGTMNEDESTQSLSDKVLDRANVLRFPKPGKLSTSLPQPQSANRRGYLPSSRWLRRWMRKASDTVSLGSDEHKSVQRINDIMDSIGRPFGHRMGQAMLHYVANYPNWRHVDSVTAAIGDQIELRILPRLRGISTEDHRQALQQLGDLIKKLGDETLANALQDAVDYSSKTSGLFVWNGLNRE